MSTKKIREALMMLQSVGAPTSRAASVAREALAELEAIERAAQDFHENGVAALREQSWGLMTRIAKETNK